MSISVVRVSTDFKGMQTDAHGTNDFPVACFDEDMNSDSCVWHWHDEFEIILVTDGSVMVRTAGESRILREGDGCFIGARQLHLCAKGDDSSSRLHSIVFHPSIAGEVDTVFWHKYIRSLLQEDSLPCVILSRQSKEHRKLLEHAEQAWKAVADEPEFYEIDTRYHLTWFLALLSGSVVRHAARFSGRESRDADRMRIMLRFIEEHYASSFSVADIAGSASISEGECIRCFRRSIHTSPLQYAKRFRILRSEEDLLGTDRSIGEIAACCGFQDPGYFARCFQKEKGMTPQAFRRSRS